ncbi:MAG: hypothetical protein KKB51_15760 [Candidatus Riflebacteria bacterium]|nr:hypothetical protein [Candidatus Riflebacteria bacterium]
MKNISGRITNHTIAPETTGTALAFSYDRQVAVPPKFLAHGWRTQTNSLDFYS